MKCSTRKLNFFIENEVFTLLRLPASNQKTSNSNISENIEKINIFLGGGGRKGCLRPWFKQSDSHIGVLDSQSGGLGSQTDDVQNQRDTKQRMYR